MLVQAESVIIEENLVNAGIVVYGRIKQVLLISKALKCIR